MLMILQPTQWATYLGALQAFSPMEPEVVSVASDDQGVIVDDLAQQAQAARFLYVLPNFQNPRGRTMTEARRAAVSRRAAELGLPMIEDNRYRDLWFDVGDQALVEVMKDGFLDRHVPTIRALYKAVGKGVAFVPGAAFYAGRPDARTLRLSVVTATGEQIDAGIAALAAAVRERLGKA